MRGWFLRGRDGYHRAPGVVIYHGAAGEFLLGESEVRTAQEAARNRRHRPVARCPRGALRSDNDDETAFIAPLPRPRVHRWDGLH